MQIQESSKKYELWTFKQAATKVSVCTWLSSVSEGAWERSEELAIFFPASLDLQ